MPKSNILIAALLLTNAVTGVALWRNYEQAQYQMQKAQAFASAFVHESKENIRIKKEIALKNSSAKSRDLPQ